MSFSRTKHAEAFLLTLRERMITFTKGATKGALRGWIGCHTGILRGGINRVLVGAFIYIPLRCSSLWKQHKYNVFYYNHLFTCLSSVRHVKTGPRGAASLPVWVSWSGTRLLFTRIFFTPVKVIFQTWKGYPLYLSPDRQLKWMSGEFQVQSKSLIY